MAGALRQRHAAHVVDHDGDGSRSSMSALATIWSPRMWICTCQPMSAMRFGKRLDHVDAW